MVPRAIRFHNTMSQRLEPLRPIDPGQVGVYVCGMTTYDHAHAGHARTFVTFDLLARVLRARGYKVTYVRNLTDVDDKILKRAVERGEPPLALSARMAEINRQELRAVGCAEPQFEPRVSENIGEITSLIEALIAKGAAYAAKTDVGTDVYFAVRAFP